MTFPTRSTPAPRPTTGSSAPTPATTSTCGSRRSACSCPTAAWPAAARHRLRHRSVHRGPAACGSRTPRSSPSTPRRACWPRRRPSTWPATVTFVHSRVEDLARRRCRGPVRRHPRRVPGAQPHRPGPGAADVPRAAAARVRVFAVHEYSVRDSRCATADVECGRSAVIIPAGEMRTGRRAACTATCGAASTTSTASAEFRERLRAQRLHRRAQRDHAGLAAQHRAHLPRPGAAMTDPRRVLHPAAPGLPDASALADRPTRRRRGRRHRRAGRGDRAGRTRRGRGHPRTRALPRRTRRRLAETPAGRHRGGDEPRLPRVLPPVLQPACAAASHRPRAVDAQPAGRLPAGRRRRADATRSADCPALRRSTPSHSRCAAPPSGCAIWSASTPGRPRRWPRCRCPRSTSSSTTSTPRRFLRDINFPEAARHLAFEVFSRSFFARPAALSAAELATMFHIYFLGSSEGLVFDVADRQLRRRAVAAAASEYLTSRGRRGPHRARRSRRLTATDTGGFVVTDGSGTDINADGVVLATDVAGAAAASSRAHRASVTATGATRSRDCGTAAAVRGAPAVAGPPGASRPAGVPGHRRSAHRWTTSACWNATKREAAEWAARTGGSVVELHAYSVTDDSPALRRDLLARLHELYPGDRGGRTWSSRRLLCRSDCPAAGARRLRPRPTVATPAPGIDARGRRHPHRSAGGADGARRHHGSGRRRTHFSTTSAWQGTMYTPCRCAGGRPSCGTSPTVSKGGRRHESPEHAEQAGCPGREGLAVRAASAHSVGPAGADLPTGRHRR